MNQELLDRLQEADPDTYHEWQWGLMQCSKSGVSIDMNGALAEAWLQASLQAAIRARGWEFVLKSVTIDGIPGFEAIVYRVRGERRDIAYTETEALLGAYLEALK